MKLMFLNTNFEIVQMATIIVKQLKRQYSCVQQIPFINNNNNNANYFNYESDKQFS